MSTRDKILSKARDLILTVGYNAFSFSDISLPLGIKNAAIHYHFPGKEALGCAVIRREHDNIINWKEEVKLLDTWQKLDNFFAIYDNNMAHKRICMVGSMSSDFYAIPEAMQKCLHLMIIDIKTWLTDLLTEGQEEGKFSFQGSPEDKAAVVVASLAAGLQISRVLGSQQFEKIKNQIKIDITPTKNDN